MVKHITQYSQHSALLELDPQELASVISSTAILGGRLNFCKEIDFLLKVGLKRSFTHIDGSHEHTAEPTLLLKFFNL